jgi:hypothetical protein
MDVLTAAQSPKTVSTRMLLTASSSAKLTVAGVWDDAVLMGGPNEHGFNSIDDTTCARKLPVSGPRSQVNF